MAMNSSRRIILFGRSNRNHIYCIQQFLRGVNICQQQNNQSQVEPQRRIKKTDDDVKVIAGDPFGLENENFDHLRALYQGLYLKPPPPPSRESVASSKKTEIDGKMAEEMAEINGKMAEIDGKMAESDGKRAEEMAEIDGKKAKEMAESDGKMAEYKQWIKDKEEKRRPMIAELLRRTNYGNIRLDLENLVQIHGQFDEVQSARNEKAKMNAYLDGKNLEPGGGHNLKEGSEAMRQIDLKMRQIDLKMTGENSQEIRILDESYKPDQPLLNIIENNKLKSSILLDNKDHIKDHIKNKDKIVVKEDDEDRPKTAEEYLKVNKGAISEVLAKTEAKGLLTKPNPHIPKYYHSPNFNICTHADMWDFLRRSIIFQNEHLVAINKPLGISIHDSSQDCRHKIIDFNEDLAKFCKVEKIHPIHRLDKDTSGVLLFAKNEKVSAIIRQKFADRQINKVYLAITKNVPDILEGKIDIPIGEGKIPKTDEQRAILKPDLREYNIKTKQNQAKLAITKYRVISHRDESCSFLEVRPETGVKHQIRVHLASAINCPILGDHKFSHPDKLAPQRLSPQTLHKLKVQQSKVRHIPMHLHCSHISFYLPPQFSSSSEEIYIHAKAPRHFMFTLRALGLK